MAEASLIFSKIYILKKGLKEIAIYINIIKIVISKFEIIIFFFFVYLTQKTRK